MYRRSGRRVRGRHLASTNDPRVSHRRSWFQATLRVPGQAFRNEVDELVVVGFQDLLQCFGARPSAFAFGVGNDFRLTQGVCLCPRPLAMAATRYGGGRLTEKVLLSGRLFDRTAIRGTQHLHDASKLLLLVFSGEDWISCVELGDDAA